VKPRVVFEDRQCLVTLKPPGMPTQGDRTGDEALLDWARDRVRESRGRGGRVFLGLVHRLDRPTAGLVVFARTSKAASRLSAQFRAGGVEKQYLAAVAGDPGRSGLLRHFLAKDRAGNFVRTLPEGRGGREARLRFERLGRADRISLLRVELLTGRPHQIRVQFAAAGCPVLGDRKYGAPRPLRGGRIALFSFRLAFDHPVRGERLRFEAWPPLEMFPWNRFAELLDSLRSGRTVFPPVP